MNNDYAWATHVPAVQAVLEIINPDFILELGIGHNSTPLFEGRNHLAIENDEVWIEVIQFNYPNIRNIHHHNLEGLSSSINVNQIPAAKRLEIFNYYRTLTIPTKGNRVLFIDGFVCTRKLALLALKDRFDIIIYHDAQPKSDKVYNYLDVDVKEFKRYYLTSQKAWTCILSREDIKEELGKTMPALIKAFKTKWKYNGEMEVRDA